MDRKAIASVLEETAVLLELKGENTFKIRAYQQAARTVLSLEGDLEAMVEEGLDGRVKGIGKTLSAHISELVRTGSLQYLEELKNSIPSGLLEIFQVQGLGPKKVKVLYEELGVTNLGELEYACRENRLITLKGFGEKTQAKVLLGIENLKKYRGRFLWAEAEPMALALAAELAACPAVGRIEAAGSFRRRKEIIKDLDMVAVSEDPAAVTEYVIRSPLVESLDSGGDTKLTFRLKAGPGVDLRLVPADAFPFALHHFTGSREHNTLMRRRAKELNLKLNEYGLFDENERTERPADEEGVFRLLGLPYIPPELREGLGEIEAAEKGELPGLITEADVKGVFHIHSNFSDGGLTIEEIVARCRELGYEYAGLSDHSRSAFYAGGLNLEDLDRQTAEVEKVRKDNPDFRLFWGIESDILPDGSLDYPDEVLARFDFVIASVHSVFNLPEKDMTARLVAAVSNPHTTILGHPTGRLLLAREPYPLDLTAVLEAAAAHGTLVEINANPHRLDLDWREMRRAKALGVRMMINPDAHAAAGFNDVRYGVYAARKGWLTSEDVLNCLDASGMAGYLAARKKAV